MLNYNFVSILFPAILVQLQGQISNLRPQAGDNVNKLSTILVSMVKKFQFNPAQVQFGPYKRTTKTKLNFSLKIDSVTYLNYNYYSLYIYNKEW